MANERTLRDEVVAHLVTFQTTLEALLPPGTTLTIQGCLVPEHDVEKLTGVVIDVFPLAVTSERVDRRSWAERFTTRVAILAKQGGITLAARDNLEAAFSELGITVQRILYRFMSDECVLAEIEGNRENFDKQGLRDERLLYTYLDLQLDRIEE